MASLRRRVDVPLAADESVRTAADPLRIAGLEAADLVVLKVAPLGGVWAAFEVADACGLPVVVSSALETSIGMAAGIAFAAALPELPYACGLATGSLLGGDVVAEPFRVVDGAIGVRRPPVDEDALALHELVGADAAHVLARFADADRAQGPA
jgi:o-succinylbenzoate synthase